jgi:hypothetical protein
MTVLKPEGEKYQKNYKQFKKCTTTNTRYDVKKQHIQSEMRAIPIYCLSQSGIRWIKLLKSKLPCLVEEQPSQGNVKMSLKSNLNQHSKTNMMHFLFNVLRINGLYMF